MLAARLAFCSSVHSNISSVVSTPSTRSYPRYPPKIQVASLHTLGSFVYEPVSVRALSGTVVDVRSANARTCYVPVQSCSSRLQPSSVLTRAPICPHSQRIASMVVRWW